MSGTVTNIGTVLAATLVVCDGEPDPADEYSAACFDIRELHEVCAGLARDGEPCICPCHSTPPATPEEGGRG